MDGILGPQPVEVFMRALTDHRVDRPVLAQQADVMDSIQHLRHEAAAAGTLWSNPQQK